MDSPQRIRNFILDQLEGGNAHVDFNKAVEGLNPDESGIKIDPSLHTIWELMEHIRIAQHDILDFSRNPNYETTPWPEGYWPESPRPKDRQEWDDTIEAFQDDHRAMVDLIKDPENDLLNPLPHGDGQTLFREAMLIVDHNAYHIGQIVQLRKALGNW